MFTGWRPDRGERWWPLTVVQPTDESGEHDADDAPHRGEGQQRGTAEVPERVAREVADLVDGGQQQRGDDHDDEVRATRDEDRAIGAERLEQSTASSTAPMAARTEMPCIEKNSSVRDADRVRVADGRRGGRVLEEGHEPEGDEADQRDEGGRLARAEASDPSGGEGRDEPDHAAQGDRDGEGAGGEAPGGLVVTRDLGAGVLVRVAIGGWVLGVLGCVGGGGLFDGDGGVDLGLTDGVGDGEGEESGDQAREKSANQEVAWGHEGVRSSSARRPDAVVSAGSRGGVDQWQG